ncbi:hypothetical protein D3C86_907210 [compost metagenome]
MANHSPRTSAQNTPPDYQSAHDVGKKRAADWFSQHGHTLAVFRDQQRASFLLAQVRSEMPDYLILCQGFDDGFAEGLAALIAGAHRG